MRGLENIKAFFLGDKSILAITGLLSYLSISMEELNLLLAVGVKCGTILTTTIYILLNYRRIYAAFKRLFCKKAKLKKK